MPFPFLVATLYLLCASALGQARQKILIDTDSAYFNDDGAALCLLLQERARFDLLGVTVVAGNEWPRQGAEYLLPLLEIFGAGNVPLLLGAEHPLVNNLARVKTMERRWGVAWKAAFARKPPHSRAELQPPFGGKFSSLRPSNESAVAFLIRQIEAHPHDVTVLALGPMTNLALAFRQRPDLPPKIRRLVFMGGNVRAPGNSTKAAETNFWFDPEAAAEVLGSRIPEKLMFGLDITNQSVLDRKLFERVVRVRTPITDIYRHDLDDISPQFHKHPRAKTFAWDTIPATYLIDPKIVTSSKQMYLSVKTKFGPEYGGVRVLPKASPNHKVRVMLTLDRKRFEELYVDLLTRPVFPLSTR